MSGPGSAPDSAPTAQASPRRQLEDRITDSLAAAMTSGSADDAAFWLLGGPRGMGKTRLMRRIAATLQAAGRPHAYLDLDTLGATPIAIARRWPDRIHRSVEAVRGLLPAAALPGSAGVLELLHAETARDRPDPARLLRLAFSYPAAVAEDIGHPLVLLLDELGEVDRLRHRAGTRELSPMLARALIEPRRLCLLASISPASRAGALAGCLADRAAAMGTRLEAVSIPPLEPEDLPEDLSADQKSSLLSCTEGRPHYTVRLARRLQAGNDLRSALRAEMWSPDGLLYQECRFEYHFLVQRCRGDAAVRAILDHLAHHEGAGLTSIARHLGISAPSALDYISWMLEVELVRRSGKGYFFADRLLGLWVLLHRSHDTIDPEETIDRFLVPRPARPAVPAPPLRQRVSRRPDRPRAVIGATHADSLIEID